MGTSVEPLIAAADRTYAWFILLASRGFDFSSQHLKVKKEAAEFADDPTIEELADVFVTVIGSMAYNGWSYDELAVAVDTKMAINEKRTWTQQDDGTYQHNPTEGDPVSLSDQLQELTAPIVARFNDDKYMSAVREMNLHDFHEPDEGGFKLISNMDSAKQELGIFIKDKGLELLEPMQVRITVEVSARCGPAEEPEPDAKV